MVEDMEKVKRFKEATVAQHREGTLILPEPLQSP